MGDIDPMRATAGWLLLALKSGAYPDKGEVLPNVTIGDGDRARNPTVGEAISILERMDPDLLMVGAEDDAPLDPEVAEEPAKKTTS